ncbi:hypothetical protein [Burkholderia ubonensis]|uniref:hypothetical protein n=1 Tax=Burkholderia ubonensis TaxID=101571 RepID=UPI000B1CC1B0|nr:hypothetical protein [Burkholderia ubonensis]
MITLIVIDLIGLSVAFGALAVLVRGVSRDREARDRISEKSVTPAVSRNAA